MIKKDVVIIGGGIIGALSAYSLQKMGLSVCLIDAKSPGEGASGCSAAMLECQTDAYRGPNFFNLAKPSLDLFPSLHDEISELTGTGIGYENSGIAVLALDKDESVFLKNEVICQKKMGLRAEWMTPGQILDLIPHMEYPTFGGALFKEDGQVSGEKYFSSVLSALRKLNVTFLFPSKPIHWQVEGNRVVRIDLGNESISANSVVVSAGAWTDEVLKPLGISLGFKPIRGQLVVYERRHPIPPLPILVRNNGYLAPKQEGYTLAGTTVEDVGFEVKNTDEGITKIRGFAEKLIPAYKQFSIRGTVAGLRPGTPDMLPFIGALPGLQNVIIAAGHYRNGILLSPITAKLVQQLIIHSKVDLDLAPYSPGRHMTVGVC